MDGLDYRVDGLKLIGGLNSREPVDSVENLSVPKGCRLVKRYARVKGAVNYVNSCKQHRRGFDTAPVRFESRVSLPAQRFLVAFLAADFLLPPFLVPADRSECWTGLIPFAAFLGMFLAPLRNTPADAGGGKQGAW